MTHLARGSAFDDAVPLHHQIYLQLRHEIADGLWVDKPFPGENEVAELFGVSVITSRGALDRLARENWVVRRRGKGTTVIRQPEPVARARVPALVPVGRPRPYRYELLETHEGTAPAAACDAFGLPVGSVLWQCRRLREYKGEPHSVTHNAQRSELGRLHTARELGSRPMAAILRSRGIDIARMARRTGVAHAPPLVAAHLGLTVVDPVLVTEFTLSDREGAVIEWVRIHLHPDQSAPEETMDLTTGVWSTEAPL